MDKTTSDALHESIIKWTKISKGTGTDRWGNNCALCQEFAIGKSNECIGCPVATRTKQKNCYKTPWIEWREHHVWVHNNQTGPTKGYKKIKGCTTCDYLAQAELKFLINLLPRVRIKHG